MFETKGFFSPDAPFRQYKKTDQEIFDSGVESGLEWRAHWKHLPGGPHVSSYNDRDHQDWIDYCKLLAHHNRVWLKGWHEGFRQAAAIRPEIKELRSVLVMEKLAA